MNTPILSAVFRIGLTSIVVAALSGLTLAQTPAAQPEVPKTPVTQSGDKNKEDKKKDKKKESSSSDALDKLIRQLGDKDYYVRQRAQDELARLGFEAMEALNAAATDDDLEIASRAKYLLRLMRVEWTAESDSARVKKLLRGYENLDGSAREAQMAALAELPDAEGIAALCRLVRFEKSALLSKVAAATLLFHGAAVEPPDAKTVEILRQKLQGCKRPGAAWLMTWSRMRDDPPAAMAEWAKLVGAEVDLMRKSPGETSPEVVARLTRFHVAWLKKLGKTDEANAAIGRMVEVCRGDSESLVELLGWLVEQKAWKSVDDLAQRFRARFAAEPVLLYTLAHAYAERGDKAKAEEAALRAFRLLPGKQEDQLLRHASAAPMLRDLGHCDWARREFEHVIVKSNGNDELVVSCQLLLAEMLHDQGHELDAATSLEKLVAAVDAGKLTAAMLGGRDPKGIRARHQYLLACHWAEKNDAAKQRECLDKAMAADPEDIDVLIACHQLVGQPAEYRAKIVEAIRSTAAKLHAAINADPEDPSMYNQYAWLVGNTEGDFDEALRCSQKSLELQPGEGGYYDTLAHVYFGRGDYENAVKTQTKAAELEPHSGLIQRKLEVFRKKLEEKKASK